MDNSGRGEIEIPDSSWQQPASATVVTLRDQILAGHFPPGERLNEVPIATALGVSRTKLREALHQLAMEGLVERIANRGTFVKQLGTRDLLELYEMREALETKAARLAAERATGDQLRMLRDLLADTERVLKAGEPVPYPRDLDLHVAILEITGNSRLIQRAREIHLQLALARSRSAYRPARAKRAFDEHVAIVDAIAMGDPGQADTCMRDHLEASLRHVQALLAIAEDEAERTADSRGAGFDEVA